MANTIAVVSEVSFSVNGKPVYLDHNEKWIAKHLTSSEMKTAFEHIRCLNAPKTSN
jgi:spore germination protein GerM